MRASAGAARMIVAQPQGFAPKSQEPRGTAVQTTRYFEEQVLRKRPYIRREWCLEVIATPVRREVQEDGRIRFWG
jgi:hypothetical protein